MAETDSRYHSSIIVNNCCVAIAFVATVIVVVVESLAGYETIGKFRRNEQPNGCITKS